MHSLPKARDAVSRARRIVLKIGSKTLASDRGVYERLAAFVARAHHEQRSVVIVSSGAIALGVKKLGMRARPKEMAKLQAAAAAGQSLLMQAYEQAFAPLGLAVAQVLLTHEDLADRVRANNARAALSALLDAHAVPVLNENDSVAIEEIKFGDNDALSSLVVPLVDADLLVLLSDVEGLLDARGARVPLVRDVATEALPLVHAGKSDVGTGGMTSKVEAARRATLAGAHAIIADARDVDALTRILDGADVGTLFVPARERIAAKKHWIAFTLKPRGDVTLDAGAVAAVRDKNKSVLAVGALGVRGDFREGDCVRLVDTGGVEIGRGLVRHDTVSAARVAGTQDDVLVHRDDLVVWPR
jgi:glutamate 5-kinase